MKKYLGFVAVSLFLLSCTNTDRDNPYDMWGSNYMGNAFVEGSSSSVETGDGPSSSSVAPSSSSVEPSSSSALPSSSSGAESSSSVALSSSSVVLSSSSAQPSSSSVAPSSSSVAPSSSSTRPSSSSVAPSSSSNAVSSSSSYGGLCAGFDGAKRLHYGKEKEQFCDERDGKKYVYVVIGTQTWMAENLNYAASGSKCGDDNSLSDSNTTFCDTYGRLYNWNTASTVCPAGWYLPSQTELGVLGSDAKKLKAASDWNDFSGQSGGGTDDYGFSALPGGIGNLDGKFVLFGVDCDLWSASNNNSNAYGLFMLYSSGTVNWYNYDKNTLRSVRCLKN